MARKRLTGRQGQRFNIAVFAIIAIGFSIAGITALTIAISKYMALDNSLESGYNKELLLPAMIGIAFLAFPIIIGIGLLQSYRGNHRGYRQANQPYKTVASANANRQKPNIPDAWRGKKPPRDAVVVAPDDYAGGHNLVELFFIAMGVGMGYLGWNLESIAVSEEHIDSAPWASIFFGYILMFAGTVLSVGFLRGLFLQVRTIAFMATEQGLYLQRIETAHWRAETTNTTRWFFLPWANVADIREPEVYLEGRSQPTECIEFTLRVTADEAHEWFPALAARESDDATHTIVTLAIPERMIKAGMCAELQRLKMA